MRTRPNYFKFRQWLHWAMKDNPLGNDHFHADDIYQDNLLDETEVLSAAFILSYGASMLEDAHRYFQKHEYFIKRPIFFCGLDDIKNCDTTYFENDDSIPNFSTLEKTATWFQYDGWNPQIFFYVTLTDIWQNRPYKAVRIIIQGVK